MQCPFCLHEKTRVSNSRKTKKYNAVWRRRLCLACRKDFTTYEMVELTLFLTVEDGKQKKPFSRPKLLLSLMSALDHRQDDAYFIMYIEATIETRLTHLAAKQQGILTKQNIIATTLAVLKNGDTAAFVKYLSHKAPNINERSLKQFLKGNVTF